MDLSWLGQAGAATIVASLFSSGVAIYLDRRRNPPPELRLANPCDDRNYIEGRFSKQGWVRVFDVVNDGPGAAYNIGINTILARGCSVEFPDGSDISIPILREGDSTKVVVSSRYSHTAGTATFALRWNRRPRRPSPIPYLRTLGTPTQHGRTFRVQELL